MAGTIDCYRIDSLLDLFNQNPRYVTESLHRLQESDPDGFRCSAINAFSSRESELGMRCLSSMVPQDSNFLTWFCTPAAMPRETVVRILRRIMVHQPLIDIRLLTFLRERLPDNEQATEWVLDLLDSVSDGRRLVLIVTQMMNDPSPRVRSKATIFVGRRTRNVAMAARSVREANSRVRANSIESLYGSDTPEVRDLFWGATQDDDNRVVANALLGLYKLGETAAIPRICEMALNPDRRFCRSAIWAIGKTGDQRFSELLLKLLDDPDPGVRREALKAMRHVKEYAARANSGQKYRLNIPVAPEIGDDNRQMVVVARDRQGGPVCGLPATAFIIRENRMPMMNYSVEERLTADTVNVGFLIAAEWGRHDEYFAEAESETLRCLEHKRVPDRWAVLRIRTKPTAASGTVSDLDISFEGNRRSLVQALNRPPAIVSQPLGAAMNAALERMVAAVGVHRGRRHVVCLLAEGGPQLDEPSSLIRQATAARVSIHLVLAGPGEAAPAWEQLARETSGMLLRADPAGSLPETWSTLASALVCHYKVYWQNWGPLSAVSLRLICADGSGSIAYPAKEGA